MLSSITHLLLSFVAKNEQFTTETQSIRRRFQILSLIYTNIASAVLLATFSTIFIITMNDPRFYITLAVALPFLFISFYFIRIRRLNAAAAALIVIFHLTNLIASEFLLFPLVSLVSLLIYPYFLLMVTSSIKVMILNAMICITRFIFLSRTVYQIFSVTINEEQFVHICLLMINLLFLICSVSVMSIIQKSMELLVWSSTEENYLKSVNQTKEAIEAMEAKNRFISMISHEIRNPLNAIKGSIDYLGQIITDQNQLKILKSAKIGGEILLNLVNNVMDAAKLRSDKIEIFYDETVLIDVLKKVLMVNSELLKSKELHANVYLEENLPEKILTDRSRLLQVLMNLFSNALKFTPVRGWREIYVSFCTRNSPREALLSMIRKPRRRDNHREISKAESPENNDLDTTQEKSFIEVQSFAQKLDLISSFRVQSLEGVYKHASATATNSRPFNNNNNNDEDPWDIYRIRLPGSSSSNSGARNGYIKVQISDSGCGVSKEDKERLFGMFEQVTESSRSSEGGSGLGLWICKQLCQRMNGDITLYSEINNGSSIVFYLPIDANNEGISHNEKEIKALVVDDFWTDLYLEKCLLEQEGVKVVTARNGREAIEKCQQQGGGGFDLVLMDVEMGEMEGYMAAANIRKWEIKNRVKAYEMYLVAGEDATEREVKRKYGRLGGNVEEVRHLKKPLVGEEAKKIVEGLLLKNHGGGNV